MVAPVRIGLDGQDIFGVVAGLTRDAALAGFERYLADSADGITFTAAQFLAGYIERTGGTAEGDTTPTAAKRTPKSVFEFHALKGASEQGFSHLLSDLFVFEEPSRPGNKLVMITDGGVTSMALELGEPPAMAAVRARVTWRGAGARPVAAGERWHLAVTLRPRRPAHFDRAGRTSRAQCLRSRGACGRAGGQGHGKANRKVAVHGGFTRVSKIVLALALLLTVL